MSVNFWLESVIDAFLLAVAQGRDWKSACAEAERTSKSPLRVLTQADLAAKGLRYSRQHVARKVANKTFPPPFQLPSSSEGKAA
jgi:predicted DNA-binding transcriptional regulator AlpA